MKYLQLMVVVLFGAVLLACGGEESSDTASEASLMDKTEATVSDVTESAGDTAADMADKVSDAASDIVDSAEEMASDAADTVNDAAEGLASDAEDSLDDVVDSAKDELEQGKAKLGF